MSELNLTRLRVTIRANVKSVMDFIDYNYIRRENGKAILSKNGIICMFCAGQSQITKEHIIPRWIFERDTNKFFNITLNGHSQTYNKSTIPACQKCNGELLNSLERSIQLLFKGADPKNIPFTLLESENLIRWLEIIDYKFQVMNAAKNFLSPKEGEHIPYLTDFPLYMLLQNKDYSPSKVLTEIRYTLKRISIKDKSAHINSLVIFKTHNESYHFFHTLNDFIFLELPKYGIAIFYFYSQTFQTNKDAFKAAMKIIKKSY